MKETHIGKNKKIILSLIFSLGAFITVFQYTDTPKVWIDEGVFTEVARNVAMHGVQGFQTEPGHFVSVPIAVTAGYPLILPVAASLRVFGIGLWQARLPMLIYIFALMVVLYLFTKKRYGFYVAILSLLLLISFSPLYGNGRSVQGEVPGLVFLCLGAFLILFWEESNFKNVKFAMLSCLSFGLSASAKPLYLVVLVLSFIPTFFFWLKKIADKKSLMVFGFGFTIPVILWFFVQFYGAGSILDIGSKYLYLASNRGTEIPMWTTIFANFKKFFTESTPILFSILALTAIAAFSFRLFKKKEKNFSIAECVILSFIIINWLAYLPGTGWYRYFFPAHTLLYLFFPAAVYILAEYASSSFFKKIFLAAPVLLIVFQFYHLVFLSDTSLIHKRTRNDSLSAALSKIDPNKKVFFNNLSEAIIFLKGDNYGQYFFCDGCSFAAGDKNGLYDSFYDYILTDQSNPNLSLPRYDRQMVDRYYLYIKR